MTNIAHHVSDPLLASYAAGTLSWPFALVVATHVSLCDECRARLGAHEAAGAAAMEGLSPVAVSDDAKAALMARLDEPAPETAPPAGSGIYPAPVVAAMGRAVPRWRAVGGGVKQAILRRGPEGSARLLHIPPRQAVPDHGHHGLEMTLVLQGSFRDEDGTFEAGDVEIADDAVEHSPVAGPGAPCICLAATEAPLRFRSLVPRLLQPILRI